MDVSVSQIAQMIYDAIRSQGFNLLNTPITSQGFTTIYHIALNDLLLDATSIELEVEDTYKESTTISRFRIDIIKL